MNPPHGSLAESVAERLPLRYDRLLRGSPPLRGLVEALAADLDRIRPEEAGTLAESAALASRMRALVGLDRPDLSAELGLAPDDLDALIAAFPAVLGGRALARRPATATELGAVLSTAFGIPVSPEFRPRRVLRLVLGPVPYETAVRFLPPRGESLPPLVRLAAWLAGPAAWPEVQLQLDGPTVPPRRLDQAPRLDCDAWLVGPTPLPPGSIVTVTVPPRRCRSLLGPTRDDPEG